MTTPSSEVFEKLASFYLGRHYDLESGEMTDDLLMYDSKDLCTHAMCVGMTGSGATGHAPDPAPPARRSEARARARAA